MDTKTITYRVDDKEMESFLAFDPSIEEKRPLVLVSHAWKGLDQFTKDKAIALAKLGYVGLAADVYGKGMQAQNDDQALELMLPLFKDRDLLQKRIRGAMQEGLKLSTVNTKKVGAIGFCFGGLTVLELLRSGADVTSIVSFHGVLSDKLGEVKANRNKNEHMKPASALFLHGNDDPMVSQVDIELVKKELDTANIDWQFHIFGNTMHAFTNPQANDPKKGTVYQPTSDKRSWESMKLFLQETLGE